MTCAIDLAHRADFRLGGVIVRPSTCEVTGGGATRSLEPRIVKVLVALADQRGRTVSRDDLILSCWDGRIVGDDAINRAVSKLRGLSREVGGFALRTIPKVGYRLDEASVPANAEIARSASLDARGPAERVRHRPHAALLTTLSFAAVALMAALG